MPEPGWSVAPGLLFHGWGEATEVVYSPGQHLTHQVGADAAEVLRWLMAQGGSGNDRALAEAMTGEPGERGDGPAAGLDENAGQTPWHDLMAALENAGLVLRT